jgi:hypothetical protein
MRRIMSLVAIAGLLLIAGCSTLPDGVDGHLTNDWATMTAPTQVMPKVGGCYQDQTPDMQSNPSGSCTASHSIEVFFVGEFSDAAASASAPPKAGSSALVGAYNLCQKPASSYLGSDWHDGQLEMVVVKPDADGWTGGARWFACAVGVTDYLDDDSVTYTSMSLQHILTKANSTKLACVSWTNSKSSFSDEHVSSCSKPHSGEFAGLFKMPGTSFPTAKQWNNIGSDGCQAVVAHYLGFSNGVDRNPTVGWASVYNSKSEWTEGDHTIRCYAAAYTHDRKFTGTVKGIGSRSAKG